VIIVGASEAGFTKLGELPADSATFKDAPEEKSVFADLLRSKLKAKE
jgi:hypothetical protein